MNNIRNINNTKIVAEVFSTNPISGLFDHKYICTGNTVVGSVKFCGISIIKAIIPIIINGAVSPRALATANIVPVNIPGKASGNVWCNATCIFDAPIPNAAFLIFAGIALILFLVAITMVGNTIKDKVKPPIKDDDLGTCNKLINTERPSKPKIIEGIAAILLILPGFISDSIGFFLLLPFTRNILINNIIKKTYSKEEKIVKGEAEDVVEAEIIEEKKDDKDEL